MERVARSDIENLETGNTLSADDKYSLLNTGNSTQNIRCIYVKNKTVYINLLCNFKICIKFRTFSKKDDPLSLFISEITDSE